MANIGGLSGGTSSSVSMYGASMKGYGGLASGLDTDSLIEGMTIGTRTKIQESLKKKDKYQWQTDAYRSVSDPLVAFSNKYLNLTSSSSPYRASFFDKNQITAKGSNSQHVSVSGVSNTLDNMAIKRVKQLAKDSSLVTNNDSSVRSMDTGGVKFDQPVTVSNLEGGRLALTYGKYTYTINMNTGDEVIGAPDNVAKFNTPQETVDTVNAILKNTKVVKDPTGADLSSKVKLTATADGKFVLSRVETDTTEPLMVAASSSDDTLKLMGFMDDQSGKLIDDGIISTGGIYGVKDVSLPDYLSKTHAFKDYIGEKSMSFTYNGSTKIIKFPTAAEIQRDWLDGKNEQQGMEAMAAEMQKRLGEAFGAGKITVASNGTGTPPGAPYALSFKTVDSSSILKAGGADAGIFGKQGVLNINYGSSNRLNTEMPFGQSGLDSLQGLDFWKPLMSPDGKDFLLTPDGKKTYNPSPYNDAQGNLLISVNGKDVKGLTVDSSLRDIMLGINDADVGIKISYIESADRYSVSATNRGEAGKIEFGNPPTSGAPTDFLKHIFGGNTTDYTKIQGVDSIMTVVYEGNIEQDIVRDSNSYNLDGATFTLNNLFGIKMGVDGKPELDINGDTIPIPTEEISFKTSVDTDKISKVISEMIDDYNKIVDVSNKLVSTKPDRDYSPLTEDQKSQMTADQIEKMEAKAKEGILFNDPLLRSLTDKMRNVFSGVTDIGTLKEMGLAVSSTYTDNGKINFDEAAFKEALLEDANKVKDLFTRSATEHDQGGFTVRLKNITDEFAKTTGVVKGSLIEKAGSTSSPTSILSNALKKAMDEIDVDVKALKKKLQVEIDRYTRQFSSLEQLISQMNSQASWFSQATGG